MKLNEVVQLPSHVADQLVEMLKETADGTTAGDVQPGDVTPSPGAGWGPGPLTNSSKNKHFFNQMYYSIKNLVVAKNVLNRMKELGISKDGQERVQKAAKNAAKQVNTMLKTPALKVPSWTFDNPKTPILRRWNEGFEYEFKKELLK